MKPIRCQIPITLTAALDAKTPTRIRGYGAVFLSDDPATIQDHPVFGRLSFGRHAFEHLLDGDTVSTFNHDMSQLIGRTTAGTLKLSTDDRGLIYDVDATGPNGRVVAELIQRGEITQSSLMVDFEETTNLGEPNRTHVLKAHRIAEIGPVTFAHFPNTTVGVLSADKTEGLREQRLKMVEHFCNMHFGVTQRR